jgi:hypothetical protein
LKYTELVKKTVHKKCDKKQEREMCDRSTCWLVGARGNLLQRLERGEEWGLSKPHGGGGWPCQATPHRGLLLLGVGHMYPCGCSCPPCCPPAFLSVGIRVHRQNKNITSMIVIAPTVHVCRPVHSHK